MCCALGRPSNPITSWRGGGALYDDIVHRREHLTAHREMKKDLEQKSLGLFFLLSVMVVLLLLSFVRNHPSVMLLSVLSLASFQSCGFDTQPVISEDIL